jgi:hypothetical protein
LRLELDHVAVHAVKMERRSTPDQSIEVLSQEECLLLLGSRDLGRIAFNVEGQPEVFPVNYAMEGRVVVFRTGSGTKLDFVPKTRLAFEVDEWDPKLGIGWSVVVKGARGRGHPKSGAHRRAHSKSTSASGGARRALALAGHPALGDIGSALQGGGEAATPRSGLASPTSRRLQARLGWS